MDAAKLFGPPGFDGILTPHDYQARGVGGVYEPEGIADSAVLRGTYFWAEMGTRRGDRDIGCESNDVFLADNSVVALHSLKSERKRIVLPGTFRVRDLITGKEYAKKTGEIVFDLKAPETRVFLLEK